MTLKIVFGQLNFVVGDIEGNAEKMIQAAQQAAKNNADLIAFPEFALCGYPIEDLVYRPALFERSNAALENIANVISIPAIVGYPAFENGQRFNKACVLAGGKKIADYAKRELPNYTVFDEKRYFTAGNQPCVFELKGRKIGLVICEDTWFETAIKDSVALGAELIISINASPFDYQKDNVRHNLIHKQAQRFDVSILYGNVIGGQDELVFDGGSFFMNAKGECQQQAPYFSEDLFTIQLNEQLAIESPKPLQKVLTPEEKVYECLKLGVRDYLHKNGFKTAILGLSGGIDSALTLCIACDAIGPENVRAVILPSRYSASMSVEDATQQAKALNVKHEVIDIEPCFHAFLSTLSTEFKDTKPGLAEENLQARVRGTILMALSNKFGHMVLTTGNKSELAVGYCTLYGDMAGGFGVLKDIYKTHVYQLAQYRNAISAVIPERVITRAPSAELSENQTDQDSLPPYPVLDDILERYIGLDESITDIINAGFNKSDTEKVVKLVKHSEYKRRQAPPGIRITKRAFGKDRRYPITCRF